MTFENKREHQTITLQALLITLPEASIFVPTYCRQAIRGVVGVKAVVDEVEVERERLLLAEPPSSILLPQNCFAAGMYILFSLNQMNEAQLIILGIFGEGLPVGKNSQIIQGFVLSPHVHI